MTNMASLSQKLYCPICGGLVHGILENSEQFCTCRKNPKPYTGWVCPVCGRGNAPFTTTCPCLGYPIMKVTSSNPDTINT